jgi:hypothetical protein
MIMRTELAALRFNPCTRIVFYRTLTISGVSHILAGMASGRDIPAAAVSPAGRRKFPHSIEFSGNALSPSQLS